MLIVFDAVSTVAVPVLPSCNTIREVPLPMKVLPENARFPPTAPLSTPGKKPAGPISPTRRLSSSRLFCAVQRVAGNAGPDRDDVVGECDRSGAVDAGGPRLRRRPAAAAAGASRTAGSAIGDEGELHTRRGQRIAGDGRGSAAALPTVGATPVRSEARRRRSDRTDIATVAPGAPHAPEAAGHLLDHEDRRIVDGGRAGERCLGRARQGRRQRHSRRCPPIDCRRRPSRRSRPDHPGRQS